MGGTIGLRGKLWGINYDYFVGVPIKNRKDLELVMRDNQFNVSYRFLMLTLFR